MLAARYDLAVLAVVRLLGAVSVAAAFAATPATAGSRRLGAFTTPSGNIVCVYSVASSARASSMECGIQSGLKPAPRNTCSELDYSGKRVSLQATGRPVPVVCAGDPGPFLSLRSARVLAYGSAWRSGGLSCSSQRIGLTCRNRSGHGFFLSRGHWRAF
jgi:hypothetical protein